VGDHRAGNGIFYSCVYPGKAMNEDFVHQPINTARRRENYTAFTWNACVFCGKMRRKLNTEHKYTCSSSEVIAGKRLIVNIAKRYTAYQQLLSLTFLALFYNNADTLGERNQFHTLFYMELLKMRNSMVETVVKAEDS
jgi:hypothetical protein